MTVKLSPAIKGLITAALMIVAALFIDTNKNTIDPRAQYLVYAIYAVGIAWTIVAFARNNPGAGFGTLFGQGFKCFIVVSLVMVLFTYIFVKAHPEYAEQEAVATREYYIKQGDKVPAEIDDLAAQAKKHYAVTIISVSIFRYLIVGGLVTVASAAILNSRN